MCQILKATLKDVKELNVLINSAYRGESSKQGWTHESELLSGIRIDEDELKNILNTQSSHLLKYTDGEIITACVLLERQGNELYLGMLTVSPTLQGMGIGKKLLKAAEEYAVEIKFTTIKMTVISVRRELIEWYKRHGYVDTGERKKFPASGKFGIPEMPLEFIVMEKRIP